MRIISYAVVVLILLLGVTFAGLNAESVVIHYYFGISTLPLSLLLVMVFTVGVMLGFLVGLVRWIKLKRRIFRLQKRLRFAEKEIENLRAIPLQDNR